jgi:hypothetical protein
VVRDAFPAWTRRPVGLLLLALALGACAAASAAPGSDPSSSSDTAGRVEQLSASMRPCSYGWTALSKVARAPSSPATDTSGAIRRLAGVPAAGQKLTAVDVAAADAPVAVQVPASEATVKVATPAGSGAARVPTGASAVPAEPCT